MKSDYMEPCTGNEYPILKQYMDGSLVMLFLKPGVGICVGIDESDYDASRWFIGEYSDDLCEENFIPYNGTVTLSN
jgi:hypothetical protein